MRKRATVLIVGLAAASAVAGCSAHAGSSLGQPTAEQSYQDNRVSIEGQVSYQVGSQLGWTHNRYALSPGMPFDHRAVSVQCPSDPPIHGYPTTIQCLATEASTIGGGNALISLTLQDGDGDFVWQSHNSTMGTP